MAERITIPTEAEIFDAEKKRSSGNASESAQMLRDIADYPMENFAALSLPEQQRLLMAARIYVVSEGSLARKAWEAANVAHHLARQRYAIVTIYRDPHVQEKVKAIKEDTRGNPYEFSTEMARDEVSYTLTLAALTGNERLLDDAIARMDNIIASAEEPTARTIAQLEQQRLLHQANPTKDSFRELTHLFNHSVQASTQMKKWERVATIAAHYTIDSVKARHGLATTRGLAIYTDAVRHDRSITTIFPRQVVKSVTENARQRSWRRTTPPRKNYSSLVLPR